MAHAVQYAAYGGPEVLEVVEIPTPEPRADEVLVEVFAAGVNPVESVERRGESVPHESLPRRPGREFAGTVVLAGPDVLRFDRGDDVIGRVDRGGLATHVVAREDRIVRRPPGVSWEVAGALPVAGTTAWRAVEGLGLTPDDTVVVTAAAGGVGCLAAQFARLRGATVLGTSADSRFDFLRQFGVIPLAYGPDLAGRASTAATAAGGRRVTAFLDFLGGEAAEASRLGVPASRTLTTLDRLAVEGGMATVVDPGDRYDLERVVAAVAEHRVRLPIADVFPLAEVGDAYRALDRRDAPGKIVLGMRIVDYRGQHVRVTALKEQDLTLGVPTPHDQLEVEEAVPAAILDGSVRRRHREERADAASAADSEPSG
ncbi:NADP-dependent oxidoreductase [Agromyces sp. MMS24-JH15]|uniref:NADP-dependent oxidoreductase n=1 Tax=Agromyces sp. MMS24-JH15 TaxID=3243765 RepID=UPI0037485C78